MLFHSYHVFTNQWSFLTRAQRFDFIETSIKFQNISTIQIKIRWKWLCFTLYWLNSTLPIQKTWCKRNWRPIQTWSIAFDGHNIPKGIKVHECKEKMLYLYIARKTKCVILCFMQIVKIVFFTQKIYMNDLKKFWNYMIDRAKLYLYQCYMSVSVL